MTEVSYPFAAPAGSGSASVTTARWSRMARLMAPNGVLYGYLNAGRVIAGAGLQVLVGSGLACIQGHIWDNDADVPLAIGNPDATNPRLDTVVLQLSSAEGPVTAAVLAGTPAAAPAAATPNIVGYPYQVALYTVRVNVGASAPSLINDVRPMIVQSQVPGVGMTRAAPQNIAASTVVQVDFSGGDSYDYGALHDETNGSAAIRAYAQLPIGGMWSISAVNSWTSNSVGERVTSIQVARRSLVDGSYPAFSDIAIVRGAGSAAGPSSQTCVVTDRFAAGDRIALGVFHTSSTDPLAILSDGARAPRLLLNWEGN